MTPRVFPFRPWVRATCRKAWWGGMVAVGILAALAWWVRSPEDETWFRAIQILGGYALLFCLSLGKIWWTAGKPAAILAEEELIYQPIHTFRPRALRLSRVLAAGLRPGTESLRLVCERNGEARELFLNLGLIDRRNEFLDALGERLRARGLEALGDQKNAWQRPEWSDPGLGVGG